MNRSRPASKAVLRRRDLLLAGGVTVLMGRRAFALPDGGRRIAMKNANTGETFNGPYRDANGPLLTAVTDLAAFLRDFHADKTGPVDIAMLDFLADVMAATGQSRATVLSAYRTRETNEKLRLTGLGVAENSQHVLAKAIDVTFDSRLANVKQAALKLKRGGVGWYPESHFVHLDSGPTRDWEMSVPHYDKLLANASVSDYERLLASVGPDKELLNPTPPGHITTVRERLVRNRALARHELLLRRK